MRIICNSLVAGGAARATVRIADALEADAVNLGLDVSVRNAQGPSWKTGVAARLPGGVARVRRVLSYWKSATASKVWVPPKGSVQSRANIWTGIARETNRLQPDVVNLHWIGEGTLSIKEVAQIRAPKVLTLTDMWYFCGSEHISFDDRFVQGYRRGANGSHSRFDGAREAWLRKVRYWKEPMSIIAKSNWIAEACRSSALMSGWPIHVVPNPIDPAEWFPVEKVRARKALGLPLDAQLVLFGAVGGFGQSIKGGDLLLEALHHVREATLHLDSRLSDVQVVHFGQKRRLPPGFIPLPDHDLGEVRDDARLRTIYSAADVMVVPSRIDTFPNTALEAHACGTPVVAFNVGGLPDIVIDGVNGRLASPFDVRELADGIVWALARERSSILAHNSTHHTRRFTPNRVAAGYAAVFAAASEAHPNSPS